MFVPNDNLNQLNSIQSILIDHFDAEWREKQLIIESSSSSEEFWLIFWYIHVEPVQNIGTKQKKKRNQMFFG